MLPSPTKPSALPSQSNEAYATAGGRESLLRGLLNTGGPPTAAVAGGAQTGTNNSGIASSPTTLQSAFSQISTSFRTILPDQLPFIRNPANPARGPQLPQVASATARAPSSAEGGASTGTAMSLPPAFEGLSQLGAHLNYGEEDQVNPEKKIGQDTFDKLPSSRSFNSRTILTPADQAKPQFIKSNTVNTSFPDDRSTLMRRIYNRNKTEISPSTLPLASSQPSTPRLVSSGGRTGRFISGPTNFGISSPSSLESHELGERCGIADMVGDLDSSAVATPDSPNAMPPISSRPSAGASPAQKSDDPNASPMFPIDDDEGAKAPVDVVSPLVRMRKGSSTQPARLRTQSESIDTLGASVTARAAAMRDPTSGTAGNYVDEEMIVTRRRSVSRDLLADSERGHKLTAALAIQNHRQLLTHYEETEILAFRSIYFLGYKSSKIQTSTSLPNLGFDAKNGDMILQEGSHLAYQYEVQQLLGKGSFGQVYKCMDHKVMQNVAVKVVKNKGRYATQADLEVQILQFLAEDPDFANSRCISLLHYFEFRKHKCIAMPLLGQNLYDFKKASGFKKSPASFVRKIAVQLLDCLAFLRKKRVVHCDLKPENILLVNEGEAEVKVIDFGSSCYASETSFTYIQSRFYRSPEVMLGLRYSHEIDMWSFGCMLPELRFGGALFTGENEHDQLGAIAEVLGPVPEDLVLVCNKPAYFDEDTLQLILPPRKKTGKARRIGSTPLNKLISRKKDRSFREFVSTILVWRPEDRPQPLEASSHPWLKETKDSDDDE